MKKLKKIISVLLILSIFIINTKNLLVFADEVIIKNKVEKSVDAKPPTIDVDSLKVNKTEVRPGDTVKISIKASDDISGIRQIDIRYKRPITGSSEDISMKYNSQKGIYEGSLYIDDQTQDGLWQIEFIFLVDNKDNYGDIYNSNINRYGDNLEDLSAGDFKVIGTNADAKPPTIDVDSLKVNKTEVRPGDTVKISIKASDDISGIRQIDIRYKRPITGSSEDISMKYNSQKGIYEGSLYIDDQTQDGLWQIEFIFLVDNKDNYGYIYNSNINRYRDNLEDLSAGNFKVKNDDNTSIIVNDIKNHWASSDINNFINKGYISGYQDGTFKPNNDITRAEFVKIVNRVFGFTEKGTVTFNDVKSSDWFYNDIAIAQKAGYINGKTLTTFAPNDKITRQEVAVILTNIMNNKDTVYDRINTFTDGYKTSSWAKSSVEGAIEAGYLRGNDKGLLNPTGNITRAEAVTMLSRVKK